MALAVCGPEVRPEFYDCLHIGLTIGWCKLGFQWSLLSRGRRSNGDFPFRVAGKWEALFSAGAGLFARGWPVAATPAGFRHAVGVGSKRLAILARVDQRKTYTQTGRLGFVL
jgi:hypothetical protein